MALSPEDFSNVMEVCLWAVPVVMVAGAAWPIFRPPRIVHSWPRFVRPLLGAATALAAAYALIFGIAGPIEAAQFNAHPGIYDLPVMMLGDLELSIGAIAISCVLFAIRFYGPPLLREIRGRPFK
jgi:hypothetical protein